jgi:uncharacterized protein (UPF0333 family)
LFFSKKEEEMFFRKSKAQAMLEYVIVLTALVLAFLAVRGTVKDKAKSMLEHPSDASNTMIQRLDLLAD